MSAISAEVYLNHTDQQVISLLDSLPSDTVCIVLDAEHDMQKKLIKETLQTVSVRNCVGTQVSLVQITYPAAFRF